MFSLALRKRSILPQTRAPRSFIRPPRPGRGVRWLTCTIFAATVTLLVLQYSFRHGRLIVFPTFDDVGYFAEGADRLQTLYDSGVSGVYHQYIAAPPHSPFQAGMAVAAFALFGLRDWAPYALNSLLALGYFLAADWLLRGAPLWQKVLGFLFIGSIPFVPMAVHEFRPDHAVALFTALGAMLLLGAPFVHGPRRRQIVAGVWFGIALLTKPPVFPQTLTIAGASLALATVADWLAAGRLPSVKAVLKSWTAVLVPLVLIPLPHYCLNFHEIYSYIYDILFGTFKASYQMRGSRSEHLFYYLTGGGGSVMLGAHLWLLLAVLAFSAVGVALVGRRGDRARGGAVIMLLALAFLIPTALKTKQPFFGLAFDTVLAFSAIFLLGRLLRAERFGNGRKLATTALVVAAGIGVWNFQWPSPRYGSASTGWQEQRRQIVEGVFHTIVSHSTFNSIDVSPLPDPSVCEDEKCTAPMPTVLLCGIGDVNPPVLHFLAAQQSIPLNFQFNATSNRAEDFVKDFDNADFIYCAQSRTSLIADFLPSSGLQDELLAAVRARPQFKQVGAWTFMKTGRSLYLFQRQDFRGFRALQGLGPVEGPFPEHKLRSVRWGNGPVTKLKTPAQPAGDFELSWEARSDFQYQVVAVSVDGQEIATQPVIGSLSDYSTAHLHFPLTAGAHIVELRYPHWHTDISTRNAVLFKTLKIERTEEFRGFDAVAGLGVVEGPFPDAHLSAVRWGFGPASKLKVTSSEFGEYELSWAARSDLPDEVVTVKLDGKPIGQHPVIGSYSEFTEAHFHFAISAGEHEIELEYTKWRTDTDRPMAVLFKTLQVTARSDSPAPAR